LSSQEAYKQACESIKTIKQTLLTKEKELSDMNDALQKNKVLAAGGREEEQVSHYYLLNSSSVLIRCRFHHFPRVSFQQQANCVAWIISWLLWQTCLKAEEVLSSQEQTARQKVNELRRTLENEKSQGSLLQAIMQAKESKAIQGIYGRLGDLGAIDGDASSLICRFSVCYQVGSCLENQWPVKSPLNHTAWN
jgi:hypothetical protein